MEKEDRQIIGNICELIPKLTPQERNNLMYLTEGMALMSRKRDGESEDEGKEEQQNGTFQE
jgi:hypothetical protein|nr:MAG TPA: hypothetical protein [Caudoviricetes sp.]